MLARWQNNGATSIYTPPPSSLSVVIVLCVWQASKVLAECCSRAFKDGSHACQLANILASIESDCTHSSLCEYKVCHSCRQC